METGPTPEETRPRLTTWAHTWRYLLCLLISTGVWFSVADLERREYTTLFVAELLLGGLAYVLVFFRRRAPLTIALVIAAMSTVSGVAAGPATLAAVSVATLRRPWPIVGVGVANFAAAQAYTSIAPFDDESPWITLLINLVVNAGMMGWGMYLGSRRELLWTLRSRAERAEHEQELRVAQARSTERARIAREMHDVVAHRITQVSMQAGALAFRDDLEPSRLRLGLGEIQGQANSALHELRDVLGVLREDDAGAMSARPQPTYDDITALVDEARQLGLKITFEESVRTPTEVPLATGRTIYRIIQEGITNARKHAPGARLAIHCDGGPEAGITVTLTNPLGFTTTATPGAGLGLVGLRERTELRGGWLADTRVGRAFVLEAWLPWSA